MLGRLLSRTETPAAVEQRFAGDDLARWFKFNGHDYSYKLDELQIDQAVRDSVVGACLMVRGLVFSEARFIWQRWQNARPGELFGSPALRQLERPWPTGTTGDLLSWCDLDAGTAGNSYWVRQGGDLVRLDPNRVMILTGYYTDDISGKPFASKLLGYAVQDFAGKDVALFRPQDVAHFKPLPDPGHPFRGRSWLSSCLSDVTADAELTEYKGAFIQNAAIPRFAVMYDPNVDPDSINAVADAIDANHVGVWNAFKALHIGGGTDIKMLSSNFNDLALKAVQGAGETRIAMAAGVPSPILGNSEGLAGSSLNTGNYGAARRRFADGTIRPLWRAACGAFETIVPPPDPGVRLWYSDRDIPFLQEDVLDAAEIQVRQSAAIEALVRSGYDPMSARDAVVNDDWNLLTHSGLFSVQLQPPTAGQSSDSSAP